MWCNNLLSLFLPIEILSSLTNIPSSQPCAACGGLLLLRIQHFRIHSINDTLQYLSFSVTIFSHFLYLREKMSRMADSDYSVLTDCWMQLWERKKMSANRNLGLPFSCRFLGRFHHLKIGFGCIYSYSKLR